MYKFEQGPGDTFRQIGPHILFGGNRVECLDCGVRREMRTTPVTRDMMWVYSPMAEQIEAWLHSGETCSPVVNA